VKRAVVLMPNGLTLFNLFCGIYAIMLALRGDMATAPGFIVLGGIADTLDGRVARATGTGSRFGEELDSLVDAISFGFAPALIVYLGTPLEHRGNLDWLLVFIFTACAVMRLARFNVEQAGRKKTHFHGLPSPAAGLTLATYYWFSQTPLYNQTVILFTDSKTLAMLPWTTILRFLMAILAALMISDVPYPAMPSIGFNSLRRIFGTLIITAAVVLLLVRREEFIFPALLAYVTYGAVKWLIIGFLGRSSTPDEIFWEKEAELHLGGDERRVPFGQPELDAEDDDIALDDDITPPPPPVRPPRRGREERMQERKDARREERREQKRRERKVVRDRPAAAPPAATADAIAEDTGEESLEEAGEETREPRERRPDEARRRRRRRGGRGKRPDGSAPSVEAAGGDTAPPAPPTEMASPPPPPPPPSYEPPSGPTE
jgi:CDP-diacylglycerol---serine O-phosphatidyltransferase